MAEQTNSDNLQPSTRKLVPVYLRRNASFAPPAAIVTRERARELVDFYAVAKYVDRGRALRLLVDVVAAKS